MMNIICNTCVGARIYQHTNSEYNNPFMWSIIDIDNFLTLVKYYDLIDFNNFIITTIDNIKAIIIDNKITIKYPHYIYNENYDTPTQTSDNGGEHIEYKYIDEYIKEKYISRVKRMSDKPTFVLIQGSNCGTKVNEKDIEKFINTETKYTKIIYTNIKFNINNNNLYIVQGNINIGSGQISKLIRSNININKV